MQRNAHQTLANKKVCIILELRSETDKFICNLKRSPVFGIVEAARPDTPECAELVIDVAQSTRQLQCAIEYSDGPQQQASRVRHRKPKRCNELKTQTSIDGADFRAIQGALYSRAALDQKR
jgi:hypothetical protein